MTPTEAKALREVWQALVAWADTEHTDEVADMLLGDVVEQNRRTVAALVRRHSCPRPKPPLKPAPPPPKQLVPLPPKATEVLARVNWYVGALALAGAALCGVLDAAGWWWMLPGILAGWWGDSVNAALLRRGSDDA